MCPSGGTCYTPTDNFYTTDDQEITSIEIRGVCFDDSIATTSSERFRVVLVDTGSNVIDQQVPPETVTVTCSADPFRQNVHMFFDPPLTLPAGTTTAVQIQNEYGDGRISYLNGSGVYNSFHIGDSDLARVTYYAGDVPDEPPEDVSEVPSSTYSGGLGEELPQLG